MVVTVAHLCKSVTLIGCIFMQLTSYWHLTIHTGLPTIYFLSCTPSCSPCHFSTIILTFCWPYTHKKKLFVSFGQTQPSSPLQAVPAKHPFIMRSIHEYSWIDFVMAAKKKKNLSQMFLDSLLWENPVPMSQIQISISLWEMKELGWRSQYSSWLQAGPRNGSMSSGRVKDFLFSTSSRQALGPTQPPIQWVPGALSPEVKQPGCVADNSPSTSA
jgi:hypothetical protein